MEDGQFEIGNGGINWSGVCGIIICILLMLLQFYLGGNIYFEHVSVLLVIGLTLGMSAISLGAETLLNTLALFKWVLVLPNHAVSMQRHIPNLRYLIFYCYASGALSSLVGFISVLTFSDKTSSYYIPDPNAPFMVGVGISLLTLLYAAMLAELIVRPLKHKIERMLIQHHTFKSQ